MPASLSLSRRMFLATTAALALPASSALAAKPEDLIRQIEHETLWKNRDGKSLTWFHPRACLVPRKSADPLVLMTLQEIAGSDYFGPVHWTATEDNGATWSDPQLIEGLARRPVEGHDGLEEGVCDVVPQYHPQTDTTLAVGHCVYYRGPKFSRGDQLARFPVYSVRQADGTWSDRKKLEWDDPRGSYIYTNNCGQRVVLPNGDILLAFTFGSGEAHRMVAGVRCAFDGETMTVKEVGSPLENKVKRGLLEPSVTEFQGRYYITIRAEDDRGYVSVSDDGLNWEAKQPWAFDNGELLTMSTTQQHWLTHSDALYLVYTRQAEHNTNVMRWRSPLYVCQVDPKKRVLLKETERVALPLVGDGVKAPNEVALMGNFHAVNASSDQSWITVGEWLPKHGARGNTLLARVHWTKANNALATS
ncbi:sialidase family protein [Blastopirellula marina]|uniref:Exo-alpha-sialidase n=1 Tax=Blastopirellula marina TaxID=124 RepID=A0A2S8GPZ9_9BACT|nr:sialidase family protein [Blastopirellula marina]PQO46516.1 exo-alpha-sialidase [Blastopirellula marina]